MTHLHRLVAEAVSLAGGTHDCRLLGHRWVFKGGKNCGCRGVIEGGEPWEGDCSLPVYECDDCGDCDYGDGPEAYEKRRACWNDDV